MPWFPARMRTRSIKRCSAGIAIALLLLGLAGVSAAVPAADAKPRWVVKGRGFGHGVGMSQWGAYGFARHGFAHTQILAHYYAGTAVGSTAGRAIRVLLRSGLRRARFRGATFACARGLSPRVVYTGRRKGRTVLLLRGRRRLANCGRTLRTGSSRFKLLGMGPYRGSLELRATRSGIAATNAVDLEAYVAGVIAKESPASWPLEALKAQAIAARSYALSTARGGPFDHYDDTRSQVYAGIRAEHPRTSRAVAETAGRVVLFEGRVAETYFFSTSGGHTENNEFSSLGFGGTPIPYLRGVPDPYDDASPYHRWRRKFSHRGMLARLGGIVRGRLKRIVVTRRGASPRVVTARLIGTRGVRKVSGPTLRSRLGLPDTWASFKRKR